MGAVSVETAKTVAWSYILVFCIAFSIYAFYVPTASYFENTYQRNYQPTDLFFSQRWSFYFFSIGSIVFLALVPITLAFAMDDTKGSRNVCNCGGGLVFPRFIFHIVVVALLLIWFGLSTLIFLSIDWSNANAPASTNAFNPANDDRWCCFYFTFQTGCFTKQACNAAGNVSDLTTNSVFLIHYWFSVAHILVMLIDILLVTLLYLPAYRAASGKDELSESLLGVESRIGGASNKANVARAVAYKGRK
jgi:hypothetical protein